MISNAGPLEIFPESVISDDGNLPTLEPEPFCQPCGNRLSDAAQLHATQVVLRKKLNFETSLSKRSKA